MSEKSSLKPAGKTVAQLLAVIEDHFDALDRLISDLSVKAGDQDISEKRFKSLVEATKEMVQWSQQLQTGHIIDAEEIVKRDAWLMNFKSLIDNDPSVSD